MMLITLEECEQHKVMPTFHCWVENDVYNGFYICPKCAEEDTTTKYYTKWSDLIKEHKSIKIAQ